MPVAPTPPLSKSCFMQPDCKVAALDSSTNCEDLDTPQGQAYKWLKGKIDAGGNEFNNCDYPKINERFSLIVFYFSTNVTNSKVEN